MILEQGGKTRAKPNSIRATAFIVENEELVGITISDVRLEPRGSPKWTVAGKIRDGCQVTTLNV
jgi:hypothetical protein